MEVMATAQQYLRLGYSIVAFDSQRERESLYGKGLRVKPTDPRCATLE